ncbi:YcnI family protein [Lacisediminihabitans profunda]|uniref:YcnI family protein n=1 Tax=Lacisediminihabitans profunda TaxID=2594790 RepID=A0A5C8US31_9MICO|nr:YcnI family protein [Lacisediminihabitans profunda]TXN31401.1 YcnI family protein [Lacisediminihabitans profunda]
MKKRTILSRSVLTSAVAVGAGAIFAIAAPLAANAHVSVTPYTAEPGSYALITFKIPNESATASTDTVEVDLPTATPFASVSYVPVAGWDVELVTETLPKPVKVDGGEVTKAVTKVVWTAQAGNAIEDGQLQLLSLSVGPVPDTGRILLPATQTYSDGTVVKWSEKGADAEKPAPVLYVTDTPVASHDADAEVTAATTAEHGGAGTTAAASDPIARGLGVSGLVVGAVGIVLAVVFSRRRAAN